MSSEELGPHKLKGAARDVMFGLEIFRCAALERLSRCSSLLLPQTFIFGGEGQVGSQYVVDVPVRLAVHGDDLVEF